jgi:ribosomal protein S18 acetylase RimI-like enzyme
VSVELRPLREDEFDDWREASRQSYADNIHEHGGIPREQADAKAIEDFDRILADGLATADQWIYVIDEDGVDRGYLWLAGRPGAGGGRHCFVYELRVCEDARGRGLGRKAMELAERVARERGLDRIELNVFGGNDVARGLYRSLEYAEVAVYMGKDL